MPKLFPVLPGAKGGLLQGVCHIGVMAQDGPCHAVEGVSLCLNARDEAVFIHGHASFGDLL